MASLVDLISDTGSNDDEEPEIFQPSMYYDFDDFLNLLKCKQNTFTVVSLNCQSLNAKMDQIRVYFDLFNANHSDVSALCLQETWLTESSDLNFFKIPGYNFISRSRSCSAHGGVAIYLKDCYDYRILDIRDNPQIWDGQFIEVQLSDTNCRTSTNLIIGNIYRPPRETAEIHRTFTDEMNEILSNFQRNSHETVLSGDFNIDLLQCNSKSNVSDYFAMVVANGFLPKITNPTRMTENNGTLIDNILVKMSTSFSPTTAAILHSDISDHLPCFVSLDYINTRCSATQYVITRPRDPTSIANFQEEISRLCTIDNFVADLSCDPNINYDRLHNTIQEAINKHLPVRRVRYHKHRHRKEKWITTGIVKSITFRDKLYAKFKKTSPLDPLYETLKTNLGTYNRILKKNIRMAKQSYFHTQFQKFQTDIKKTWMTIKDVMGSSKSKTLFPTHFEINDENTEDSVVIANAFNKYFAEIGPNLADKIHCPQNIKFQNYLNSPTQQQFSFQEVNAESVSKIIDSLKSKPSYGWDGMSSNLLKTIKNSILESLTLIVNQVLLNGVFPDKLKVAKVTPVFKKGSNKLLSNYRPISVLPAISKVIEKIMHKQIHEYFTISKFYYTSQYGFRSLHSTELAAAELTDRLYTTMDQNQVPLNIYLDLSKAFDTLDHDILLQKLQYYGLTDSALHLLQSYLTNRKQYVVFKEVKSEIKLVTTGVPQGSVLGPLLFIIYMNDFVNASSDFYPIIYADDSTLFASLNSFLPNADQRIDLELMKITHWLMANKLSLNASKTKAMLFHMPQKKVSPPKLTLNSIQVEYVTHFDFLGITLDSSLSWNHHISKITNKISKTTGILNRLKRYLPQYILKTIYNTLVMPHLTYGILLWGCKCDKVFKLQKKALRIIFNAKFNAHTDPLFIQSRLLKIQDIRLMYELKFAYKLINDLLPQYFLNDFLKTRSVSRYNIRNPEKYVIPRVKHEYAKQNCRYRIPKVLNEISDNIVSKISTHSLQGFSLYIKNSRISTYISECDIRNCYICSRQS